MLGGANSSPLLYNQPPFSNWPTRLSLPIREVPGIGITTSAMNADDIYLQRCQEAAVATRKLADLRAFFACDIYSPEATSALDGLELDACRLMSEFLVNPYTPVDWKPLINTKAISKAITAPMLPAKGNWRQKLARKASVLMSSIITTNRNSTITAPT